MDSGTLEEVHDVEFDETKGSQVENENLKDVRGIQLSNHLLGIYSEFETTIKRVRSYNGSEFKNTRIDELCDDFRIRHQISAKYTPQSNDHVEMRNRTLIDMARSMLIA